MAPLGLLAVTAAVALAAAYALVPHGSVNHARLNASHARLPDDDAIAASVHARSFISDKLSNNTSEWSDEEGESSDWVSGVSNFIAGNDSAGDRSSSERAGDPWRATKEEVTSNESANDPINGSKINGTAREDADVHEDGPLRVRTHCGWVRGREMSTASGRAFRAFRGIPYAEPPLGKHRFRPPEDKRPWEGTLDAGQEGAPCLQVSHLTLSESGAEDCLFLNVYAPMRGTGLPVLVYMHGGSFLEGHGGQRFVEPQFLLEHDVVLVSFNYRLGPFGFLSTEDAAMPGNYGLKDALSVLRWVNASARFFGGGQRVTMAGASAGAAAVHLLALAPAARPLLSAALLSSGCALARWALTPPGTRTALRVAPLVGCDATAPSQRLVRCLRRANATRLLRTYRKMRPAVVPPLFAPVLETHRAEEADGDAPLLTEAPALMTRRGAQVPLFLGVTSDESYEWGRNLHAAVSHEAFQDSFLDEELAKISPVQAAGSARHLVARLRNFYFGGSPANGQLFSEANASALFSDALFNYPAYYTAVLQAQARFQDSSSSSNDIQDFNETAIIESNKEVKSVSEEDVVISEDVGSAAPVYFYVFAYPGRISETARRGGPVSGVVHGDDLLYVLGRQYPVPSGWPNASEARVAELLVAAWTSFVESGAPLWAQQPWEAVRGAREHFRFLEIDARSTMRKGPPFGKRMKFWERMRLMEAAKLTSGMSLSTAVSTSLIILTSLSCYITC